ncbi:MAG: GntR family transcriptional regulator [Desulfitibacter sp. BRH_c19]|nr:MAG: GntR family transcriptional regulator [Desulfitibacter sp. BRH_c19]
MQFTPIKPRKIYEQIVEQIKAMVTEGNLKPGDRLPSEREMADRLTVSRASVREALSALHLMGLVEIKSGEGTFIRQTSIDSIIEPLAMILLMERDTVLEILEVRKGLEVEAAGLAAMRHDKEDLGKMREALDEMHRDIESLEIGEKADWKFHYTIAQASRNVLLARLMNTVSDTIENTMRTSRQNLYATKNMPKTLLDAHEGIYEAISQGNSLEARRRMYEHLLMVENNIVME